ncbi:swi5-dependent recombination DNA repair protein 1 homolog [Asterias rubens]|uniref:swi5-dependent recombination DNA repair protein 1 homolog n=1 Tax=Asterias rubens TaxID=7604 RepID=UPI001455C216|nr:swi5-dependent recombination DNA repair protein 1 homolog [Asterias rubens]XP_033633500.1 swi5-dependent recombination DNA repair protein 1 homolog [Asterias rubens]XP_033633501.1 swi5-dependent recombination DNA repair protein 1 homolog [Asterias rubens]
MDIPTEEHQPDWKSLQRQVAIHTETLRKLKMVKMYRTKNNLSDLEVLIEKWRSACQTALMELHQRLPEPRPTMGTLITDWKIDPDLLNFDPDGDSFT